MRAALLLCLLIASLQAPSIFAGIPAVAAPEPNATRAAAAVLERGGNAVDAAIATAFVLAVTLPDAGNLGGGGFMTLYVDDEPAFLDYRETAPAAAERDMYLDVQGQLDTHASLTGHRAVGVPGTVAGLWAAHQRYGSLSWASLVAPAINLAENGFIVPSWFTLAIDDARERLADSTNFLNYFGKATAGDVFVQPELAATLKRIAALGPEDFYRGETAKLIAAEMQQHGGLITAQDLAGYEPRWRQPLVGHWQGYDIVTAPPPSSGGIAILQYLQIKSLLDGAFSGLEHNSAQYIHLKAEIEKRIFADRAQHLGDPDFVEVPLKQLLSAEHLSSIAAEVNPQRPSATEAIRLGVDPIHTTHFSIIDADGNAVSNTYTLNTDFGSGVVVTGAGFLLNNEMDDFSAAPGQPNYYGVVGDDANAIAPGKRMLSSMSPTILLRDDGDQKDVAMVVGAMGGSTIFTTVYQTISNIIEFGMGAEAAQAQPRVHHQLLPSQLITFSPTTPIPESTQSALEALGYRVEPHPWEFGNVQLIWIDEAGTTEAAADPRFAGEAWVGEAAKATP